MKLAELQVLLLSAAVWSEQPSDVTPPSDVVLVKITIDLSVQLTKVAVYLGPD
jgi:hypothetical protein